MSFLSPWLLPALLLAVLCAWLPPRRFQVWSVALCGAAFLGCWSPLSLALLAGLGMATWRLCGRRPATGRQVVLLVVLAVVVFVFFKRGAGLEESPLIPLGLSYYLFRLIHFALESYTRRLRPHQPAEFLAWLLLLPTLIVGPIHRFPEFLDDLRRRRWEWARFSLGLERALHGYAKLVILANWLIAGPLHTLLLSWAETAGGFSGALLRALHLWIDLYCRFSAYSDIAIGVAAMMGFTIIENFNSPFLARNIGDFWRRWHISLTGWCQQNVFLPVAALTRRPAVAIAATMLVIGLWHELSLRYLLWGLYHAGGIAGQRRWSRWRSRWPAASSPLLRATERTAATLLTLCFVVASFPASTWLQERLLACWELL
jgi:alginate O-acetyltransferase complex protein AlgI